MEVSYYNNPTLLFVPRFPDNSILYTFIAVGRDSYDITYIILIIVCIFITLVTFIIFLNMLLHDESNFRKWLPEQKWVVAYLISILLYVNPIGVFILFGSHHYPASIPFANIIISHFGGMCLSCIWLFFAAPLLCRQYSPLIFYTPRIMYCFITFIFGLVVIIYAYSFILRASDAGIYISQLNEWPIIDQDTFFIIATIYHCLDWLYYIIWIAQMIYTRYQLSKISYMKNRYIHLSFHYFTLQGGLLIIFYFLYIYHFTIVLGIN